MIVVFMAAPVAPVGDETFEGNLDRARRWYRQLSLAFPSVAFLAPWVLNCECFEDTDSYRRAGIARNCEIIRRCDELWLVGPRVSPGMVVEAEFAERLGMLIERVGCDDSGELSFAFEATA